MSNHHVQPARNRALPLLLLALAELLLALQASGQANANPPERMTYQGYVVDANGNPLGAVSPRNYDIIFRIWNDATSTSASARLWTEQQTVTVDKGYFSILLGEGASIGEPRPVLSTLFTNSTASDRWVGLTVKGIGGGSPPADVDILPRIRLLTSPYSFLATKALNIDGGALLSGTIADARLSANVALRAGGNTFSGNQIFNNSVGIGTASPGVNLDVNGSARLGLLTLSALDGANEGGEVILKGAGSNPEWHLDNFTGRIRMFNTLGEWFSLLNNGNLGLGLSNPDTRLHVNGGIKALGDIFLDNQKMIRAKNSGGTYEEFLIPRWSNNGTYLTYGAGGLFLRTTDNTARMVIDTSGNVGIGTSGPTARLHVNGGIKMEGANVLELGANVSGKEANAGKIGYRAFTTDSLDIVGAGNNGNDRRIKFFAEGGAVFNGGDNGITIRNDSNGEYAKLMRRDYGFAIEVNATSHNSGVRTVSYDGDSNWDFSSDRRLKKDIVDAEPVLDRLIQMPVRRYHWNEDSSDKPLKLGVIAQEVQPAFPELVRSSYDRNVGEERLTVKYTAFGLIAAKAVQELKAEKDAERAAFEEEIQKLRTEVESLKRQLSQTAQVDSLQRDLNSLKALVERRSEGREAAETRHASHITDSAAAALATVESIAAR